MRKKHLTIPDPEIREHLQNLLTFINVDDVENFKYQQYEDSFREWLETGGHEIKGLENFKYSAFSNGTSSAFGEFISRHPNRTIRVSNSEFLMAGILSKAYNRKLVYIEDHPITENDLIIMSLPFCGNGGVHKNYNEILIDADRLGVPVLIDGAYFGISKGLTYDFNHSCITDFTVSLSKCFDVMNLRLGIRFTKEKIDDGISAGIIAGDIFNRYGGKIAVGLMREFSAKFIPDKYQSEYLKICKLYELTPTNTVTLALGNQTLHKDFMRGEYARLCISEHLL